MGLEVAEKISLIDKFAGDALSGIMTNIKKDFGDDPEERICNIAYKYAEKMVEVREKRLKNLLDERNKFLNENNLLN